MSFEHFLLALVAVMVVGAAFILLVRIMFSRCDDCGCGQGEEEVETVTTTVVETVESAREERPTRGTLRARVTAVGQWWVRDPVDGTHWWLNPGDDRYEDAGGVVWAIDRSNTTPSYPENIPAA